MVNSYTLKDFNDIIFDGFEITLSDVTLIIISELSQHVGSPTYIKTPIFHKRENPLKTTNVDPIKKRRGNKTTEVSDEDWDTLRKFQTTTIEEKVGIELQIDLLRVCLNKMTDKVYNESCGQIVLILDQIVSLNTPEEEMVRIGNIIFEIASNNRFFSKLYADLYSLLIEKYEIMRTIFNKNLSDFMNLFTNIEYGNPDINYDNFCKINKDNEKRKALSMFFVNLCKTRILTEEELTDITSKLLFKLLELIELPDKKNEVHEITENIAILYNKPMFEKCKHRFTRENETFSHVIFNLANCNAKSYKGLTSKSIFKFMDLVEMEN